MGLLDEALEVARKGIATLPQFSPGYAVLGRVQAQRSQWQEAGESFGKALAIDGENVVALKGLAKVYLQQGRKGEARDLLRRAAALQPENAALRKLLDRLEESQPASSGGDFPSGAGQEQPIATATIAEIYLRQGFLERAAEVYRGLLQADSGNEEIRRKLTDVERRMQAQNAVPQADDSAAAQEPAVAEEEPENASLPAAGEKEGKNRQVVALNRWLDAIRKRRENV